MMAKLPMAPSPFDRKTSVYVAKLAEQAQRYDDMMEAMKEVAREVDLVSGKMTEIERNLLAGGFRGKLASPRQSWRILCEMEKAQGAEVEIIMEYKKKLGEKIGDACREVLAIIEEPLNYSIHRLDPNAHAAVFYYMLKGDCYRYLAEIETKEVKKVADEALKAYEDATKIAAKLPTNHPLRLGLHLNHATLCYEILKSPEKAISILIGTIGSAQRNQIAQPTRKADIESNNLLNLLRNNLRQWELTSFAEKVPLG